MQRNVRLQGGCVLKYMEKKRNGMQDNPDTYKSETVFDRANFMDRLEGDAELARDLASLFLEDAAEKMAELDTAISSGDTDAIEKIAHSLKGAAANVSAPAVRQLAYRIERAGRENRVDDARQVYRALESAMDALSDVLRRDILQN